ncbi:serine hydrolase [Lapillicoccus sp.]|uniref:serine hydrolase n=1 Tax=Lapillicoccus sp. TaxID=1909287 RepID=UPI0039830E75
MDADRLAVATRLQSVVEQAPGRLGVAVTTGGGWSWSSDAHRVVPSASTIKVPILLAALKQVEEGRLALATSVALPSERVGGSGPLSLLPSVTGLPLGELLTLMISLSDNDATNVVIDLLGEDPLTELLASVPTASTRLQRRMMDVAAAQRGLQNETCAADLVALLVALRQGRLLGPSTTLAALDILRTQQFREGLPAYLTEDISVASKTGEIVGVRGDVALFERQDRWVVAAALATDLARDGVDRGTSVLPTFATIGEIVAGLL